MNSANELTTKAQWARSKELKARQRLDVLWLLLCDFRGFVVIFRAGDNRDKEAIYWP
jgi:hypothetical protein